ncbi:MAG TPA: signal peptidase I, partial [Solirubrobacterales bacterium]|nr:signal peptidase I [Solirubrobacterales bacterium]
MSEPEETTADEGAGRRSLIPKPDTPLGAILELVVIVAMAIGLALGIQALIVKPFQIPSESMKPLLVEGERVLVNRLAYSVGGDPSIGDVVVFHPPNGADGGPQECGVQRKPNQPCPEGTSEPSDQNFIKRIVAGPGDTLYVEDGHPVVNGEKAEEDFIRPCGGGSSCNLEDEITIPADSYFMMGDNRGS